MVGVMLGGTELTVYLVKSKHSWQLKLFLNWDHIQWAIWEGEKDGE